MNREEFFRYRDAFFEAQKEHLNEMFFSKEWESVDIKGICDEISSIEEGNKQYMSWFKKNVTKPLKRHKRRLFWKKILSYFTKDKKETT